VTPAAIEALTAASSAALAGPPVVSTPTAGRGPLAVIQSMPEMSCEMLPVPVHESTRTACSVTRLATP
jgi:hypothetical protein